MYDVLQPRYGLLTGLQRVLCGYMRLLLRVATVTCGCMRVLPRVTTVFSRLSTVSFPVMYVHLTVSYLFLWSPARSYHLLTVFYYGFQQWLPAVVCTQVECQWNVNFIMIEPAMIFSQEEQNLLKQSFAKISADPRQSSLIFYEHLFEKAPETRELFLNDMARQGDKLIATLSAVVLQIGDLALLKTNIEDLGLRHVAYGVQPDHYSATGAALFRMLEHVLGDDFSADMRAAWEKAYAAISHIMIMAVENRKSRNRDTGDLDGHPEDSGA